MNYANYIVQACGNMKIYLDIYYLGCDNAAKLQYSFFISISIVYVMQYQHEFCTQIAYTAQ